MITNMMITALLAFNIPELLPPRRQTGLWRHGRMPAPSEFVRGGQDALLQVVERTVARFLLSGPLIASSGLRRPVAGPGDVRQTGLNQPGDRRLGARSGNESTAVWEASSCDPM